MTIFILGAGAGFFLGLIISHLAAGRAMRIAEGQIDDLAESFRLLAIRGIALECNADGDKCYCAAGGTCPLCGYSDLFAIVGQVSVPGAAFYCVLCHTYFDKDQNPALVSRHHGKDRTPTTPEGIATK